MDDIARLVLAVDSRPVVKAADSLDGLATSGGRAERSINSFTQKSNKQFAFLAKTATAIGVAFAGLKLKDKALEAAVLSQRYQELGLSVEIVGRNVGVQNAILDQTESKLQKLGISMIKSRETILKLAASNIDLANAEKLADLARNAAIVGQLNTSDALDRIVNGIRSGESEILKTIGLSVQFGNAYKRMAEQLGITSNDLTENQKIIARTNETLRNAPALVGLYEKAMENAGKKFRSTDRLAENLSIKIGALFDSTSVLAAETYTDVLKAMDDQITQLADSGTLELWGDNLALIFAHIGDSGRAAIATLVTLLKAFATGSNQLQAILTLNFDDVVPLGDAFINATKERFSDLNKLVDETNARIEKRELSKALAEEARQAGLLNDQLSDTEDKIGQTGNSGASKKINDERKRFLDTLKEEFAQLGKTNAEIRKMEAAQLGASKQADVLIDKIEKKTNSLNEEAEILRNIERVTDSVSTSEERFIERVAELDELLENGLGTETYTRALEKARKEILGVGTDTKKTTDAIVEFWKQANRNIQSSLADGFFNFFDDGLSGMVDGVKNTVKRIIAEFAALKTAQSLGLGTLLGGASGSALASSGSLTSSISNLFSAGSSIFTNFSNGVTGALSSGITSLGNTFGSTALTSFASGLNGSAAAGVFGAGGIPFLGGAGTAVGTQGISAAGLGAGFGSAVPIIGGALIADQLLKPLFGGAKIGGLAGDVFDNVPVIGTLINGLFGKKAFKQKEQNLSFFADSEGINDGLLSTKFKAKGGLLSSSSTKRVITDLETGDPTDFSTRKKKFREFTADQSEFAVEIGKLLDETVVGMSRSISGFVENLGGSADVVDSFSASVNIASEKGKAITEEQIAGVLDDIGNQFAEHALPIVNDFRKHGEDAFDTLQRLSDQTVIITNLGNALGHASDDVKSFLEDVDFAVQSKFVDDAGGVQALNSQVSFFSQNFLDPEEQIAESRRQVEAELGELGLSLDTTKDQFRDLVQSFDPLNEASKDTVLSLLKIAPAFLAVKEVLSDATGAALDFADSQKNITQLRSDLVSSYNRERSELQGVISEFDNLSNTLLSFKDRLRLGELSPLTPGQKLDDARQQFNSTRRLAEGGDAAAIAKLPEIAQSFLQASQTFNASGGTFSSDFNFVQSVLDSVGATAKSEADLARLQLTELESTVSVLTEIDAGVTTIDQSIQDLTAAVLTGLGNPDISNKQINDWLAANPDATPQDIVNTAVGADISADQFIGATGANPANVSVVTGGLSITDDQIREFVAATPDPFAIHQKALEFGISSERLSNAIGLPHDEILKFVKDNNLAEFQTGTDFVPNTGLALVHKGEAVTPSTVPAEIKLLREEIKQLREDQNRQTDALINVTREASQSNAKAIVNSNKETNQLNPWADRSAVRAG